MLIPHLFNKYRKKTENPIQKYAETKTFQEITKKETESETPSVLHWHQKQSNWVHPHPKKKKPKINNLNRTKTRITSTQNSNYMKKKKTQEPRKMQKRGRSGGEMWRVGGSRHNVAQIWNSPEKCEAD